MNRPSPHTHDTIIIGAGAAGMMCAIAAGRRGRRVLVLDHKAKIGEKIRISGGGRCNFTNIHTTPANFLSQNPHFCTSALKRYTPADFIALVKKHGISFHEKTLGQLFCDDSATQIIDMLLSEIRDAGGEVRTETTVHSVEKAENGYTLSTSRGTLSCASLVIATGGLSIPKIGATGFAYDIARQFDIPVVPTRAALVPLTFDGGLLTRCKALSGLSVEAEVAHEKTRFAEGLLFTHRGLSGPSILQISSYWKEGEDITVNLARAHDVMAHLKEGKTARPKAHIANILAECLPKRLAQDICDGMGVEGPVAALADARLAELAQAVNAWRVRPTGTEGYRTAEVTLGGVDTRALSSKTMESSAHKGLYFIGEAVDVTGHLGGFNFQWAWASGHAAGQTA